MKNLSLIIIIVSLCVGGAIGYIAGTSNDTDYTADQKNSTSDKDDMHMMPDGSMMSNDHSSMSMSDMMHNMNANLEGKKGDELDKAFIDEMIIHHEGAIEMAEIIVENSNREELIKLGKDIISTQQNEIDLMKEWRKNWFK